MGAGILPVAIHNKKIYLLLGKEKDTHVWSDFGGGKENNETHIETACREGAEELNGFIGSQTSIKEQIRKNGITVINNGSKTYRSYLFEIAYDSSLPNYFNNNFKLMRKMLPKEIEKKNGLFEKSEIRWFSLNDMRKIRMRKFYYHGIYPGIINFFSNYKV